MAHCVSLWQLKLHAHELCVATQVRYSLEQDNDDTLAAHAQLDGACILSRDYDFFR